MYRYTLYNSVNKRFSFVLYWAIFSFRPWSFTKYPSPFQTTSKALTIVFLASATSFNHIFPNNNTRFIVAPFVSCAGTGVAQCCSLEESIGFTIYHLSFRFCLVKIMITVVYEAKNLGIPRCSTRWAIGQLFSQSRYIRGEFTIEYSATCIHWKITRQKTQRCKLDLIFDRYFQRLQTIRWIWKYSYSNIYLPSSLCKLLNLDIFKLIRL